LQERKHREPDPTVASADRRAQFADALLALEERGRSRRDFTRAADAQQAAADLVNRVLAQERATLAQKIQKLQAVANDPAATPAERETALRLAAKLQGGAP
jgi:hypothetical protein